MKLNLEERSLLHFACGKLLEDKGLSDYADNFIHNSFHCPDDDDCCGEELNILFKSY